MKTQFHVKSVDELAFVAEEFLKIFEDYKIFAFYGEMGVGKTTFISYLANSLEIQDPVSSPTFGYVNEYQSPTFGTVYHFDFYRIESEEEAYDIGTEEYIYGGELVFMEWAENIENLLPESTVRVYITKDENESRLIEIRL